MIAPSLTEQILARRDALRERAEQAKAEYAQLEQMLAHLQRSIDAMHGGLLELDALLADLKETPHDDPAS